MTESPDELERRQRARVAVAQLQHPHHRGYRADGQDGGAQFVIDVRYDEEDDVSYALSEDRFGEAMDAVMHFVEKAVTAGGKMTNRVTPREREDESGPQSRRATDALAEIREATEKE